MLLIHIFIQAFEIKVLSSNYDINDDDDGNEADVSNWKKGKGRKGQMARNSFIIFLYSHAVIKSFHQIIRSCVPARGTLGQSPLSGLRNTDSWEYFFM